jgi:hypothetical protein
MLKMLKVLKVLNEHLAYSAPLFLPCGAVFA